MKYDMIIAGVGGQGILSIATAIGRAALALGLRVKQSEVHGMAQRGGAVQAHLRLADAPIHADLIPRGGADMILAMEPLEALRYLPWLKADAGWVVANREVIAVGDASSEPEAIWGEIERLPRRFLFDAGALARSLSSPRSVNMAMLGAASVWMTMPAEALEAAVQAQFERKGEDVAKANVAVFWAGRRAAEAECPQG